MKISTSPNLTLSNVLLLLLSACVVTSAISLQSIIHDFQRSILSRSLPGSLALAPEGAVGQYEPPPGPVMYGASPTETGEIPQGSAFDPTPESTNNESTGNFEDTTQGESDNVDDPRKHIAPVSEMDAFIQKTYTASASKSVVQSLACLVASLIISLLHL
ncbi:hypothetical protein BJX64DRAFT_285478 [Aspergillus heterothallicus]